jgi:hypothetical protein
MVAVEEEVYTVLQLYGVKVLTVAHLADTTVVQDLVQELIPVVVVVVKGILQMRQAEQAEVA